MSSLRNAGTRADRMRFNRRSEASARLVEMGAQMQNDLAFARPDQRDSIRESYEAQARLVVQQETDRRFESRAAMSTARRQSELRQRNRGGTGRLDAELEGIIQDTRGDARGFEQEGNPDAAAQRRRLGGQFVRERRDEYYRSIEYGDASPNRTFGGRSSLEDLRRKFREAEGRAGETPPKGSAVRGDGGPTSEQMGELLTLMRQFFNKNFIARAS